MRRSLPLLMVTACTFDPQGVPTGDAPVDAAGVDAPAPMIDGGDPAPPDAVPASPDAAPPSCAYGYRVVSAEVPWAAAAGDCADDAPGLSHLLVLEDDDENASLDALVGNAPIWVGISDELDEGTWLTVLGGVQTYLPWGGNAPDGSGNCAERAGNGRWNDLPCSATRRYICECPP